MSEVNIDIQPTPNPNALKFILNMDVKKNGSSTFRTPMECGEVNLGINLFTIRGIDQIHFFENVITITKFNYEDWEDIEEKVVETIKHDLPNHNPEFEEFDPEKERRENLPKELKDIEEVLDRTVRQYLQADGGDIQTVSYEDNILLVRYQGACGTCPSSTTGTLEAIKSTLRAEYNPEIDVYIAPDW
ncbi:MULTISPECIES: NifU family protein [Halobacteriovorax]|uniref:NifU family protein n=1 Tax=Halobacteriovorax vibrionivorans TaxID=2152716 RepID=A0ABY0IH90_9BACT|nr:MULTISPECIES: NifU family protein [Halobacteriovorax]AYF44262.1 scaffold protein Nfu/NifU N-terminal domain protein [Halobacteriovorax sp. BALOs_7]RZF21211.1 NifU family protein [Halobacteriovorax vibrionivorans]TGD46829.1 NifU family protein [Halobacteriovorax sp. Y22]